MDKLLAIREKKYNAFEALVNAKKADEENIEKLTNEVIEEKVEAFRIEIASVAKAEAEAKISAKYDCEIKAMEEDIVEFDEALKEAGIIDDEAEVTEG